MNKLLIWLVFLLPMQLFAQKVNHLSTGSLINASNNDSTFVISTTNGFTNIRVFRSDVGRDTINTKWVYIDGLNADFTFEFGYINISGTDTLQLYFEAFRGNGTPDSSGISRHSLEIFSQVNDTTKTYHFPDSTFVSKRLFSKYRLSIYERGNQQNDYIVNVNHFSPQGKQPIVRDE